MEIPKCESVVLSLSWGFLELAECLWDVSLCISHGLVLFPQHILVTCHTCLNLQGCSYVPRDTWQLPELATKAKRSRLYMLVGSILQAHGLHAYVYRPHVKV